MANRTVTIYSIVENLVLEHTGKTKYELSRDEMIDIASPYIFENYPIFDENFREELNRRILSHFYYREIVCTPFGKWKHYLNEDMYLHMPYFNELYRTQLIDIDYGLFDNIDLVETLDRDLSGKQIHDNERTEKDSIKDKGSNTRTVKDGITTSEKVEGKNDLTSNRVFEDTPQTSLMNKNYATDITNEVNTEKQSGSTTGNSEQNTNVADINNYDRDRNSNSKSNNKTSTENTEDYVKTIKGRNSARSQSELLIEYRRTLINVTEQVCKKLEGNFSGYFN